VLVISWKKWDDLGKKSKTEKGDWPNNFQRPKNEANNYLFELVLPWFVRKEFASSRINLFVLLTKLWPIPFDVAGFHGVETGVWGGVRMAELFAKLSLAVTESSTFCPIRPDIDPSRILRLTNA